MQKWGNQRVNEYYEAKLPPNYPHPNEQSTVSEMEKFIREKYVEKRWVADTLDEEASNQSKQESYSKKKADPRLDHGGKVAEGPDSPSQFYLPPATTVSVSSVFDSLQDFAFTLQPTEKRNPSSTSDSGRSIEDTTAWIMSLYAQPQRPTQSMGWERSNILQQHSSQSIDYAISKM